MAIIAANAKQAARLAVPPVESSSASSSECSGQGETPSALSGLTLHCIEPPRLKYNITEIEGGVLLSIWEPAAKNDVRVKPFLFMSRHRMPSEREAKNLLAHYLSVYRKATQKR